MTTLSNSYYEKVDGETKKIVVPFIIPSTWEWVRLCSLGQIIGGGTPSTDIKEYWENGTISWITPADMGENKTKYITSTQRKISELGLSQSSATLMPPNSIVMSSRAPIGYLGISKISLCTNQGCKSIVPYCSELVEYLYYAIMMAIPDIKDRASGTTFKEISGKGFGQTIIPLPPLLEQKRIVDLLIKTEKQFAIVQSNYSDMIKQVEVLKYRILDSFFGENSRYKSYYTEKPLCEIAKIIFGQSPNGSSVITQYSENGIEFHQGKTSFGDYYLEESNRWCIEPTKTTNGNSIVMSVRAPVGDVNICKRIICIGRGLCSIEPYSEINEMYLFYLLLSKKQYLESKSTGSTFSAVNSKTVKEMKVVVCEDDIQRIIVDRIEKAFSFLDGIVSQ